MHGQHQSSSVAIKSRLKLFTRFLDHEAEAGRLVEPFLPEAIDDQFLKRFRAWGIADPIVARKKNKEGEWVAGQSRKRSESTVEESIIQLKAAIKHAYDGRRIRYNPPIKHKPRAAVTPKRNDRLSLAGFGELLDYTLHGGGRYAIPQRLLPLRRYVIGAICTLARPDAIMDMNVAPDRAQWQADVGLFDLNPAGRLQTNKRRPILPVVPVLRNWLGATDEWFVCQERASSSTSSRAPRPIRSRCAQSARPGIRRATLSASRPDAGPNISVTRWPPFSPIAVFRPARSRWCSATAFSIRPPRPTSSSIPTI